MESICVFIHYGHSKQLPYPESVYVNELSNVFSKLIIVTNQRDFKPGNLNTNVSVKFVKNEGYDFGMFYKVATEIDWTSLDRLAVVNDSNILLGHLAQLMEKGKKLGKPFWGAIDSYEKPWFSTHPENHHLQSHFLVWEKKALAILQQYLNEITIDDFFGENDLKKVRRKVINDWEIGVSQYFKKQGLLPEAVFKSQNPQMLGSAKNKSKANDSIKNPGRLLEKGYPFLKKKYVYKQRAIFRLLFPEKKWENLVRKYSFDSAHAEKLILSYKN